MKRKSSRLITCLLSSLIVITSVMTSTAFAQTKDTKYVKDHKGDLISVESLKPYMNYVGSNEGVDNTIVLPNEILPPDDGGGNVGAAWPYTYCSSSNINCYGYASRFNFRQDPGYVAGLGLNYKSSVNTVASNVISDMHAAGRNARTISSGTTVNANEYRIALRTGLSGSTWDYHFMLQCSDGTWCEKHGTQPSINDGYINPSTFRWDLGTYLGFYNSATLYIACTK